MTPPYPPIRIILAPNPSAMTQNGTNSYLVGRGQVALIDPGPNDPRHHRAILSALHKGEHISHIFVTHAHLDHSAGARAMAELTGAPVLAFGPPWAGRSNVMARIAAHGTIGGGEGVDHGFRPDIALQDGQQVHVGDRVIQAHHTPGHFCNHLSFQAEGAVFTGDIVMGWTSTLISPPDGDLGDYFHSLTRLDGLEACVFHPGHGDRISAPRARLAALRDHRHRRSDQIHAHLSQTPASATAIAARIYGPQPPQISAAAVRNTLAHLIDFASKGVVLPETEIDVATVFHLR